MDNEKQLVLRPKGNWYSNEDQDDIALTQEHLVAKEILA
jgi:hypothetical protein